MRVAGYNLGCKVNKYELDSILESFSNRGYEIVSFNDKADIYIINTCAVTKLAEKKSRQMINKAKKNDGIVVAIGCYMQKDGLNLDNIDIVLGATKKNEVFDKVEKFLKTNNQIKDIENVVDKKEYDDMSLTMMGDMTRAYVKIQDGCDNFCSYCIIPYLRGRVRSRDLQKIEEEVINIVKNGYKEVVLTGIEVASYGKDLKENKLIDVIETINKIEGLERIRLSSVYPNVITEDFMDRISKLDKVCNHFHLSLQSGSTSVLKRMNRKYTADDYKKAVDLIRKYMKDVALTTDVIVGFPGESDNEFNETYEFLKSINFSQIHIFKYSIRKGTVAEKMENQILTNIKELRSKRLSELVNSMHEKFLDSQKDKLVKVLFEQKDKEGYYEGHTTNYIKIYSETDRDLKGKLIDVKIKNKYKDGLFGIIVDRR